MLLAFTIEASQVLDQCFEQISTGDSVVIKGIAQTVAAIQNAVTNPDYSLNGNMLSNNYI